MDNSPKVSVIVVNYNSMPHIDVCISSILKQDYISFEVIFVDNASTDGSLEYARKAFPELVFIANDRNLGYADGINSALDVATGQYVAPTNIDTEVAPNWLSGMVSFMEANPLAGAVSPKILLFDQRTKVNARGLNIHISGLGFCRMLNKEDDGSLNPVRVSGISGCSYLIRREVLEQMGGAPRDCFMANDDVIVSWLLNLMGYQLFCVPEAVVFHKYQLKMNPEKLFRLEKCRQMLLLSSLRTSTLVICLPVFGVIELLILVYSMLRGKQYIRAKFKAFMSVAADKDARKKKRLQYRSLARISDFTLLRRLNWNLEWGQLFHIAK